MKDSALSNLVRSFAKFEALKAPRVLILECSKFFYLVKPPFLIEIYVKQEVYFTSVVCTNDEISQSEIFGQKGLVSVNVTT